LCFFADDSLNEDDILQTCHDISDQKPTTCGSNQAPKTTTDESNLSRLDISRNQQKRGSTRRKAHAVKQRQKKTLPCRFCTRAFAFKSDLEIHIRSHTGEKPFVCSVCSKSFSRLCNLNIHMRIHTGEMNYTCHICFKSFNVKCNLDAHLNIHTGKDVFLCEICSKTFNHISCLKRHKRVHERKKLYKCNTWFLKNVEPQAVLNISSIYIVIQVI